MIRPFQSDEDVEKLVPVIRAWIDECRANDFGIEVAETEYLDEVSNLINLEDCDLLVLEIGEKVVGLMSIAAHKSPIGSQRIADAHFWYTLPEARGKGINFIKSAKAWARAAGCSHIIFTSSAMAGADYDKICTLYERMDMKRFETTFIEKL